MDQIHEAFMELSTLGIVTSSTRHTVVLNLEALYSLGYVLVLSASGPAFVTIVNYNYMYNPIQYVSSVVPKAALASFVLSKIQTVGISS